MKHPGPLRRRVDNPRNSECGSARIGDLDWSSWFTDGTGGGLYLHVRRNIPDLDGGQPGDETRHRFYCRLTSKPRLAFRDGALWWLIDRKG
jgi:hypothetical protein